VLAGEASDSAAGSGSGSAWFGDVGGKLAMVFLLSQAGDEAEPMQVPDDNAEMPLESLLDDELRRTLHEVLAGLPDDARHLVKATYFEGKTLKEAGEELGISKAWASRLHARALEQLARGLRRAHVAE
jgi:RNA polymerase sigma factor for flagellar operon FliA